jgi:diguanylate cyclase (GGDEF)-like protein
MRIKFTQNFNPELLKIVLIVLILSAAFFFLISHLKFLEIAKLKTQDIMMNLAYFIESKPNNLDKIAVVAVDDDSFKILNKKWPWRRVMFAYLVYKLSFDKPKVIAIDFSFIGESEIKQDDTFLSKAFSEAGNVLSASYFTREGKYMKPLKKIARASRGYGFINKPRDDDFFVRRSRAVLFSREDKKIDYSLSLKAFAIYKGISVEDIVFDGKKVRVKDTTISVDKNGTFPLNYRLKFKEFTIIPFWQVIKADLPKGIFKDKIVLVGPINEILHDIHNTPLGLMPGVIINANELLMFMNNSFARYIPLWIQFLIICIFVLGITILTYRAQAPRILLKVIGAIIIFWELGLLLFLRNIRMDYFSPSFLIIASYMGVSLYRYFRVIIQNISLKTQAITDELTGLFTYRYFVLRLNNELERAKRYNLNLSLIITDIDHFKNINDTYGHETGNIILQEVSEILKTNSRKADVLFRYGGEEFCVILTNTSSEGAFSYSEKIRTLIEQASFAGAKCIKLTLSFGVATFPKYDISTINELINAADIALYHAKHTGRNRVILFEPNILSADKTKSYI